MLYLLTEIRDSVRNTTTTHPQQQEERTSEFTLQQMDSLSEFREFETHLEDNGYESLVVCINMIEFLANITV